MKVVRIPTPLRAYTQGQKEIPVEAESVREALQCLAAEYPSLVPHLFDEHGSLRSYVNVFLNEYDVRNLDGESTPLKSGDRLVIVPSIAGGSQIESRRSWRPVDHAALKLNQAMIIGLLVAAFVFLQPWLVLVVALFMIGGTILGLPGFTPLYRGLRRLGMMSAEPALDNPEPHRFAQGLGGAVLLVSAAAFQAGQALVGWALAWAVIGLAALNLFGGFCVGCALYYWLGRLAFPKAVKEPPPGTLPGARPHARV